MLHSKMSRRRLIQLLLLPVVFSVISLGWRYPLLGFVVPLVMSIGIVGAFSNGRYVCGNLCPRGAFFDLIMTPISPQKKIPPIFRNILFRLIVIIILMSVMIYRISKNVHSLMHWGRVFWLMCVVTTTFGVVLALIIRARTWCAFCPIGTLGNLIGHNKRAESLLKISTEKCTGCRLCERVCPMNLSIISKDKRLLVGSDCIKCWECVDNCKHRALHVD